jgi:hypothetical protein
MMKHGLWILTQACWLGTLALSADPGGGQRPLTAAELEQCAGGDLSLVVNRDRQVMTVTRTVPGTATIVEEYTVPVVTSVVRSQDITASNLKNSMMNTQRDLAVGGETVFSKQFPTGTARLSSRLGTQAEIAGPVIRTNATQDVFTTNGFGVITGARPDYGYNIHYADPAKGSNTLGCIGVPSEAGMAKVASSLAADTAATTQAKTPLNQQVTVTAYTKPSGGTPATITRPTPKNTGSRPITITVPQRAQ